MKRNAGIYLILLSFIITAIGSVLKIKHAAASDFFLAIGIIAFVVGFGIVLYKLSQWKSA
jgi:uncharacterized membrane protein